MLAAHSTFISVVSESSCPNFPSIQLTEFSYHLYFFAVPSRSCSSCRPLRWPGLTIHSMVKVLSIIITIFWFMLSVLDDIIGGDDKCVLIHPYFDLLIYTDPTGDRCQTDCVRGTHLWGPSSWPSFNPSYSAISDKISFPRLEVFARFRPVVRLEPQVKRPSTLQHRRRS
ncbi:hypothetical protein BV22DRAFT_867806 [Leucogyrophana mollusca]|uniref:Uncharacterized protein n=1 Tax=Leucogyrophana mollusca TaxID=85980 RepID=A0ACB8B1C1_9AGAM|nr:hypothetical protein BV22DRAFT_867806 [Leucogyrophana mollusca]